MLTRTPTGYRPAPPEVVARARVMDWLAKHKFPSLHRALGRQVGDMTWVDVAVELGIYAPD